MAVCQNLVPLVNIKIAGKWMFIPLKLILIGIDPCTYNNIRRKLRPMSHRDYLPQSAVPCQRNTSRRRRLLDSAPDRPATRRVARWVFDIPLGYTGGVSVWLKMRLYNDNPNQNVIHVLFHLKLEYIPIHSHLIHLAQMK